MNAELEDLLARHLAGELDESGQTRLLALCRRDAEARRALAGLTLTERFLNWLHAERDADTFAKEVVARLQVPGDSGKPFVRGVIQRLEQERTVVRAMPSAWRRSVPWAAAAALIFAAGLFFLLRPTAVVPEAGDEFVARLTGLKDCQWNSESGALHAGAYLHRGQHLELTAGVAEITFDCGAQIILQSPASCDLNSAWDATLQRGTAKAKVPPQAIGFRIASAAVEVVDLGTEFTLTAEPSGTSEVLVLKGEVEALSPRTTASDGLHLREKEARRFASSGVEEVVDREEKFARYSQPVTLDREPSRAHYLHWSFDEPGGDVLKSDLPGVAEVHLEDVSGDAHVQGRWDHGLNFNGAMLGKASVAGLSTNAPRTVLFWTKIPEDAQLSNAYAMVAWRADSAKLGSRAVHIGWNRNPLQGEIGALRTDFARGFALGATPLRDGRWHHVAVVFVPGERADDPVQVKQYVDGRLEGSARKPARYGPSSTAFDEETATAASDVLWLGCRLGSDGPRKERFRGSIDELFVADRALTPAEIVHVMVENHPLISSQAPH